MENEEDSSVMVCPDNHRCENGSVCVESSEAEGRYFCDCEESMFNGATVFSGLYCQHKATVFCTASGSVSKTSFCTNMGTCRRNNVNDNDVHLGCDCPKGYTGKHCQFIEGSEGPEDYSGHSPGAFTLTDVPSHRGGNGVGLGTGGMVSIILVALFFLSVLLAFVFRRHAQTATTHVTDSLKTSDGNLYDADGSNLAIPTQTFESDRDPDDLKIHAVDSGHLA